MTKQQKVRGDLWTPEEMLAAVHAYWRMLDMELRGEPYSKREIVRELRASTLERRSHASVEMRMQNISAVLEGIGHARIQGYRPARNVGVGPTRQILAFWAALDPLLPDVLNQLPKPSAVPPAGNPTPQRKETKTATFQRDPAVVAWALARAGGHCECCGRPAPFTLADGTPYLEVHHVQPLANSGEDTPGNVVAICPNCHKEAHYGARAADLAAELRTYLGHV